VELLGARVLEASRASPRILIRPRILLGHNKSLMLQACIHPIGHGVCGFLKNTHLGDIVRQLIAHGNTTIDKQRIGFLT
jgi:hypothetical protein